MSAPVPVPVLAMHPHPRPGDPPAAFRPPRPRPPEPPTAVTPRMLVAAAAVAYLLTMGAAMAVG